MSYCLVLSICIKDLTGKVLSLYRWIGYGNRYRNFLSQVWFISTHMRILRTSSGRWIGHYLLQSTYSIYFFSLLFILNYYISRRKKTATYSIPSLGLTERWVSSPLLKFKSFQLSSNIFTFSQFHISHTFSIFNNNVFFQICKTRI